MKLNINKLILIEVIAGILLAFITSKILHMTAALQIMYLPFELIGKGLRFLSLSSVIGNVIAINIYSAISMIPAIYVIDQRKRGRKHKEDILLVAFTVKVSCSIGVYRFTYPKTIKELLTKTDEILYEAKANGRGCFVIR